MGYNVKVEEVDKLFEWISTYCSETESQLSWAGAAVGHMASLEGFEGAAAQSVKSYFSEVHLSAIGAITLEKLKELEFDPKNFRIETPSANRSRRYE